MSRCESPTNLSTLRVEYNWAIPVLTPLRGTAILVLPKKNLVAGPMAQESVSVQLFSAVDIEDDIKRKAKVLDDDQNLSPKAIISFRSIKKKCKTSMAET